MRRHLEAAQLEQAQPARRTVGRIELVDAEFGAVRVARHVDEDVAQCAIDEPGRHRLLALAQRRESVELTLQLAKRDLELVELIVAGLVDARRLARRTDEEPGEQIRQRRMVVPIADEACEQIGAAQEWAVGRRRGAQHHVIAAACTRMASVEHELFGAQIRFVGGAVKERRVVDELAPRRGRMDVDFDDAGIGRHLQQLQARIARRRIAFDHDLDLQVRSRRLDGRQQVEIVVERGQRRHEDIKRAAFAARRRGVSLRLRPGRARGIARFDAKRRAM